MDDGSFLITECTLWQVLIQPLVLINYHGDKHVKAIGTSSCCLEDSSYIILQCPMQTHHHCEHFRKHYRNVVGISTGVVGVHYHIITMNTRVVGVHCHIITVNTGVVGVLLG